MVENRRDFIKKSLLAGMGLGITGLQTVNAELAEANKLGESYEKVPRKTLGKTGESVPIINVGGAQRFNPKYDKILHNAFKEGVNYIDTALMYEDGESHRTIAPFLKQVGRKNVFVTTKVVPKKLDVEEGFKTCLEQLDTDYVDLFYLHNVDNPKYLDKEFIKIGDKFKKEGKTRFFGFTTHGDFVVDRLNQAAKLGGGIDVIMFRYNFAMYGDLELNKAIDACKKANIGLVAMKTQKSVPTYHEDIMKFMSNKFTLPQAKLKVVWSDERIDSICSHMTNTSMLKENLAAAKSKFALTMNEFSQLQKIATATAPYSCNGCGHICTEHVDGDTDIASVLRHLMYYDSYGEKEKARRLFADLAPAERLIDGVDFSKASQFCPQGIDLQKRMEEAHSLLA